MANGAQLHLLQKMASTGLQEKEEDSSDDKWSSTSPTSKKDIDWTPGKRRKQNYVMLKWPFSDAQLYLVSETKRNTKSYYATHDGTQQK